MFLNSQIQSTQSSFVPQSLRQSCKVPEKSQIYGHQHKEILVHIKFESKGPTLFNKQSSIHNSLQRRKKITNEKMTEQYKYLDLFFQTPERNPCLSVHIHALLVDADRYLSELKLLWNSDIAVVIPTSVRARVLAALHITSHHKDVTWFLKKCEGADVAKALNLLDRPRKSRQLQQRIQKIETDHPRLKENSESQGKEPVRRKVRTRSNSKKPMKRRQINNYRRINKSLMAELCENDHGDTSCTQAHKNTAVSELIQSSSVSGALARKVRTWAKTCLDKNSLQLIMLGLPADPWKTIADLVHFHPNDFVAPKFLEDIHTTDKEETTYHGKSFVRSMRALISTAELSRTNNNSSLRTRQGFRTLAEQFPEQVYHSYSFIRTQPLLMKAKAIVEDLARSIPLDVAIWYFEELYNVSQKCEEIIASRFNNTTTTTLALSESSKLTYGKLVERILTFHRMKLSFANELIPIANVRLTKLKEYWNEICTNNRVAVFGDASSSMQTAIEASTIFASMVSSCFHGELSFFSHKLVVSPHKKPTSVEQTLDVCRKIRASGCTSLAAALWPYYEKEIVVDTIVLVTDEEENTPFNGNNFASLLRKYKEKVNENVSLVIVCVGDKFDNFRSTLKANNITSRTLHIDERRPDLAKFDAFLGQLAMVAMKGGEGGKHLNDRTPPTAAMEQMEIEKEKIETGTCTDDFVMI